MDRLGGEPTTIILCAYRSLTVETAECMLQMRDLGWGYRFGRGDALIERVRSREVSRWYKTTDEDVFLMIDDDIVFAPEHAQKVVNLAREKRSIAVAAYPVKDGTHTACRGYPGQVLTFGPDMPPVEIAWPATGFMAVHRDVIKAMIESGDVPECYTGDPNPEMHWWPFFYAFWMQGQRGDIEPLSEDYAFGERARRLGFNTWLDQSIELFHLGQYPYCIQNMHGPGITHADQPTEAVA